MHEPEQVGTILFVLKLLMIGVDDINCQVRVCDDTTSPGRERALARRLFV